MWFWLSCTTCSGQKEQVRLDKPAAEYFSWQLFISLFIFSTTMGLDGHHCILGSSHKCFCMLDWSHLSISFWGPSVLTAEVSIFSQQLHYIKQLLSLWALFSLANISLHSFMLKPPLLLNRTAINLKYLAFTPMHHSFPVWYANKNCMLT